MMWHLNNIRRDCSCRGDSAGYSHLSCIIEYATHKFEAYLEDMEKIPCPWETCPTCLQDYTNDLAIDLAKEYVAFGEQKYARSIPTVVLHAYVLLLESLTCKHSDRSPAQYAEARKIANTIISKAKRVASTAARGYEAFAYEILGCMLYEQRRKEDLDELVGYLEKSLEIRNKIGDHERAMQLKETIAMAKAKLGSKDDAQAVLKHLEQIYECAVKKEGESSNSALMHSIEFAGELNRQNYGVKAEKLLNKSYEISLRTLGPDHFLTKRIDEEMDDVCIRSLALQSEAGNAKSSRALTVEEIDGGEPFYSLTRYDGSFYTLTVNGPFSRVDPNLERCRFRTTNDNVIFDLGTPVFSHDAASFGQLGDIIAWNLETQCYTIRWEDDTLDACEVHQSKIRVPFDVCIPWDDNPFPIDLALLPKTPEEDERMMRKSKLAYDKAMASKELNALTTMASKLSWS